MIKHITLSLETKYNYICSMLDNQIDKGKEQLEISRADYNFMNSCMEYGCFIFYRNRSLKIIEPFR